MDSCAECDPPKQADGQSGGSQFSQRHPFLPGGCRSTRSRCDAAHTSAIFPGPSSHRDFAFRSADNHRIRRGGNEILVSTARCDRLGTSRGSARRRLFSRTASGIVSWARTIFPSVALFLICRFAILFPEKIRREFFLEYVFKLILAGTAQQQNCLKIGPYHCHDCGM